MSAEKQNPVPKVLEIIRTAAADCRVQGNTMAANELLDASSMASDLLDALNRIVDYYDTELPGDVISQAKAASAKAQGGAV